MEKQPLLNTYVNNLTMEEALGLILEEKESQRYLVPVNVDMIMKIEKNEDLKQAINGADYVVADGKPLIWISKYYGNPLKEKISGSDLIPVLLPRLEENGSSIFVLGGAKQVNQDAVFNIKARYPNLKVWGYSPPFGFEKSEEGLVEVRKQIDAVSPDVLLVCFGCPKQELWIKDHLHETSAGFAICGGGTVDFLAGKISRCPKWMSNHGLEWFYRFLKEPRRLFKRYFIDDPQILPLIFKYKKRCKEKI